MKTGLVLEGGGMRGIYTVGVLDRLMEEGIESISLNPDTVVNTWRRLDKDVKK